MVINSGRVRVFYYGDFIDMATNSSGHACPDCGRICFCGDFIDCLHCKAKRNQRERDQETLYRQERNIMNIEIQGILDTLRSDFKDADPRVRTYIAQRSLHITEAVLANSPHIREIVQQEYQNILGAAANIAIEKADSLQAAQDKLALRAIEIGIQALLNI